MGALGCLVQVEHRNQGGVILDGGGQHQDVAGAQPRVAVEKYQEEFGKIEIFDRLIRQKLYISPMRL